MKQYQINCASFHKSKKINLFLGKILESTLNNYFEKSIFIIEFALDIIIL
jgi:hypothetical protein